MPEARYAAVDAVLDDPPRVHPNAPTGVWSTDVDCYRFLADRFRPGTRTLETGCGVSTVLLTVLGAEHVCVTPGADERAAIETHLADRGIDASTLRFEQAASHEALPRLLAEGGELDLVLVDGGHGFPMPILDWFYAGSLLRRGGVLVADDIGLPAVRMLVDVLDRDPRWRRVAGSGKWAAWERQSSGPLAEDWTEQPHLRNRRERADHLRRRITGRLRRELQRGGRRSP
jgi:predicted O-methyltransferase YrrM